MFPVLRIRQYHDTKIAYCRFQFDSISTNIYGRDGARVEKLRRKMDNFGLAVLEYQPIMWLVQSSILPMDTFLLLSPIVR